MHIPTEPIGSIPRPVELIEAIVETGDYADPKLDPLYEAAIRDTVKQFEAIGSPLISDGEQRKYHNFWTYCVHGSGKMAREGYRIGPIRLTGFCGRSTFAHGRPSKGHENTFLNNGL
jgi:5-methyltetrahydropteroyltriglutamate--homocysteine methyltransferase